MSDRLGRVFETVTESFAAWIASLEISRGRLVGTHPLLSLLGTLLSVSAMSFSHSIFSLSIGAVLSVSIGFMCVGSAYFRSLKIAAVWSAFSAVIILPLILQGLDNATALLPLRVFTSITVLSTCVYLVGISNLLDGLGALGISCQLIEAIKLMVFQVYYQLRDLGRIIIVKSSRFFGLGLLDEYGILSMAVSELFIRGPERSWRLSKVMESKIWSGIEEGCCSKDCLAYVTFT
ncbi:MAG TPA: hypothetical protein ENF57_02295, partial [Candidatus Korarchaeota archaeon]|nr:hypothetical protein [Candidatus Korarchaeota archaeon]